MIPPDIEKTIREELKFCLACANDEERIEINKVFAYLDTLPAAPAPDSGELLPCPFCNMVEFLEMPLHTEGRKQMLPVTCPRCGAEGPPEYSKEEAIASWNRRTTLVARPTEDAA